MTPPIEAETATADDGNDEAAVTIKQDRELSKLTWLFIMCLVGLVVGGLVFFSATRFREVRENTRAIRESCQIRNENVRVVNEKLNQLNILVAARLKDRPDGTPNPPDVIAAAEALKKPIPLTSCDGL